MSPTDRVKALNPPTSAAVRMRRKRARERRGELVLTIIVDPDLIDGIAVAAGLSDHEVASHDRLSEAARTLLAEAISNGLHQRCKAVTRNGETPQDGVERSG